MRNQHISRFITSTAFLIITLAITPAAWGAEKLLHVFQSNNDGMTPEAGLVSDAAGNLYGTAVFHGPANHGIVFKLTRGLHAPWQETILYSFTGGADGDFPTYLAIDAAGNLFGVTEFGGRPAQGTKPCLQGMCGVVFELSPSSGGWKFNVLYSLTGFKHDGTGPSGVTLDAAGNLYITTIKSQGICATSCGALFKLTHTSTGWKRSSVHSFGAGDGENPRGGVIIDAAGNLYGTTQSGGTYGFGTAYEMSPVSGGGWAENILHSFSGGSDGSSPQSSLRFDSAGNLFGTTGGGSGQGMVFELVHGSGQWTNNALYSFTGGSDGRGPIGLVFDSSGNLYGTTIAGGDAVACYQGCGVVYKLSPGSGTWNQTVLYTFTGVDGQEPRDNGLVLDPAGNLFGTTSYGGKTTSGCQNGCGVVFEVTP